MSRATVVGLLLVGAALGCRDVVADQKAPAFVGATEAVALDTLSTGRPVEVSVAGIVVEPPADGVIVLQDPTGAVRVALPDTIARLPDVRTGTLFLAQGLLRQTPEGPVVEAREWLYDSTAVPVRSP